MFPDSQYPEIDKVFAKVFEESDNGILITDANGTILAVNGGHEKVTGYRREELIGNNPSMMKSGIHDDEFYKQMWSQLVEKGRWKGEVWDRRKDGELYFKALAISSALIGDPQELYYLAIFSDVTEKKHNEARLEQLAHYDQLTKLPNRVLFFERLKQAIAVADRNSSQMAVMFLDLDGFKRINDTLGHRAGDILLQGVGERLKKSVRESDTVARMGGDEFTVIVTEINQVVDIIVVARKILACLSDSFLIDDRERYISASVGIAVYPFDGGLGELVKNADVAMYEAKRKGKNRYQFYSAEMNTRAMQRLELETELRRAVKENQLILHYQPQWDMDVQRIVAVEALLRWQHPENGLIPPDDFISVAEETDFIGKIGEWVIKEACNAASRWNQEKLPPVKVWVNVAGPQFAMANLVPIVRKALEGASLPPEQLGLELTERTVMRDLEAVTLLLRKLSAMGIELAIDDFGIGHSSLRYLSRFPLDHLKIPKEFIDNVATDSADAAITAAIIAMGRTLDLKVIAEGVETFEQLEVLKKTECDIIQGYLISKPLCESDLVEFLLRKNEL